MQDDELAQQLQTVQQQMSQQQFATALMSLELLLKSNPELQEALYMAAVCQRYQQQFVHAQDYLKQLFECNLEHGRGHQEQGYLLREQGLGQQALAAFQRATQINPALEASWRAQADLAKVLDRPDLAQQPLAQLKRLKAMPKALVAITDLLAQGKIVKAEVLCRQVLERQPRNVEAMRLLAGIASQIGAMQEAEILLENACQFDSSNSQLQIDYIQLLRKRQRFHEALQQAGKLLETDPDNPQFQSIYAIEAMQAGDINTALEYFDKVLKQLPDDTGTITAKGHAHKTAGNTAEAIACYQAAASVNPEFCEAYYALANLKTYRFGAEEINAMLALEPLSMRLLDKVYLSFALAKAYEDGKKFEQSFQFYQQGNALKKQQSGYNANSMSDELQKQSRFFTAQRCANLNGCGDPAADPIFILGLPRSGSTLLEQILSSHSQVEGTLELPNILAYSKELRRHQVDGEKLGYPEVIAELDEQVLTDLGSRYLEETKVYRNQSPFFIDKMPNNFRHIGLIKLILPNAKIIDARRHPMACCFSGYKQLFAEGQEFSYSLSDMGQYYTDYVELMEHWDNVLPGQVLRVHYEQVIDDLEGQVRRILDFCGLPFESACLSFHETKRSVRTASSEQVRQPIFKTGLEQWKNYSVQLSELQDQLADIIDHYPA
ncbi:TPR domain protein [marine gamma proteobacterium HTCC2143]|uniref:TPR domain protein n=1 Tax=marine gamma proteobacterium HTCC2143 TaxID=247633 RepID=A0YEC4_9GAMM|nr:TPR domain protein [marine gamma proteobacterium HTCC2143]